MAQCIIYARVSTRQQAWGHGLARQIECCSWKAKEDGAWVRSVYVDIASATRPRKLKNRQRAIQEAKENNCAIYFESVDRWTRCSQDDSLEEQGLSLVSCDENARRLEANIAALLEAVK
jgi:DNA invertase Pin-like site-specific DNA recombinase